jgi:hypothetical protein
MVINVYERSFSYKMHMIQNACNLRYKDAYTSCYICHAKFKKCTKESYTYATKELRRTNSLSRPGRDLRTTPCLRSYASNNRCQSTKCSSSLPPEIQKRARERTNDLAPGLVLKELNQCRAICSKVGLAKSKTSLLPKIPPRTPPRYPL